MVSVRVERDLCIGSGKCVLLVPETFQLDGEEIAIVVDASAATEEALERAASRCPAGAIFLNDEASHTRDRGGIDVQRSGS